MKKKEAKGDCIDCDEYARQLTEDFEKIFAHKPMFDTIRQRSYSEALDYWENNIRKFPTSFSKVKDDFRYTEEELFKSKDILHCEPSNDEERETYNKWYLKNYIEAFPSYDLNKYKERFFEVLEISPEPKMFIEDELGKVEKQIALLYKPNLHIHPAAQRLQTDGVIYEDYVLRGQAPDWKKVDSNAVSIFAAAKFRVDQRKFLKDQFIGIDRTVNIIERDSREEKEIVGLKKWNLQTKYFLLQKLGFTDLPLFKGNDISQTQKWKLIANILNCSPRNAKKIFNGELLANNKEKKEVELFLTELK